jgi:hypothetical protein
MQCDVIEMPIGRVATHDNVKQMLTGNVALHDNVNRMLTSNVAIYGDVTRKLVYLQNYLCAFLYLLKFQKLMHRKITLPPKNSKINSL